MPLPQQISRLLPGVLLCAAVTLAALGLARMEEAVFGRAWLEALVLAILLGTVIRTAWKPGPRWKPGIDFSAKMLLEVAVVLLGASLSVATILAVGPALLLGIALVVAVAIMASYGICRLLGLPARMAVLVACGNSICGNSAIAAVAPVVGADSEDVASSIAFTAVLGVVVVLLLPLLVPALGLSLEQYGVLAGLTVYAVPQVLAATAPVGALSVQVGTLVKLVRVLMLGPVVVGLSLLAPRLRAEPVPPGEVVAGGRPRLSRLVPWFIIGFLGMAVLRTLGLLPQALLGPIAMLATALTILSMAALGLGVDVRTVARSGGRVVAAGVASLLLLGVISLGLIRLLGVA
ncbi:putative sulfate exporter family transporter [Roseomonas sp. SSH11]|uniref:Sulfate exporter family transporter n=1 Tax=Pararoseomonas baculiformis TaxID=2820812 RepID=A0ABS4A8M1_9PROT|nr:putative sulfate exporter family transporter [Pararoseomonas baculiformis]MBP0443347.1 putative sulfate exporter family transporter [Pararoseomonas baculiformis]